jgi:GT2 family glycosyltransferase
MAVPASICFPTRRRRGYLEVALASVAPQAAEHGAEIVVVEDEAEDPATRALTERHDGRYVALGGPKGINVARNACVEHARGELICLLDDDVRVWPGWLGALLEADGDARGGPIRPVFEGVRFRSCGREPLPITALDLGPADVDAEFLWGANLAFTRTAFERAGPFDPALAGSGDEKEWEARLRAAGGRIRYVAKAGVDHRRAGADARLRNLSRGAYHRGREARKHDTFEGKAPSPVYELRTLAGCVWHTLRRGCMSGIVLTALSAGRVAETFDPSSLPPDATAPDFLSGRSGTLGRRTTLAGTVKDALTPPPRLSTRGAARRSVHVVGIVRPENLRTVARLRRELARSQHAVELQLFPGEAGRGKWENLNAALDPVPDADWLLLVDDDVVLPRGFLDRFVLLAERFGFELAQPAHAFASHAAWEITRRRPGMLAHRTRFVEIGPVVALSRRAAQELLPFPDLRMGWGLDTRWSAIAAQLGWQIGFNYATQILHLKPVAAAYPRDAAIAEDVAFLDGRAYVTREQAAEVLAEYR